MAARAIWKGVVRFGGVEVPVKLYSAVEDRKVHFHLLDTAGKERVHQRMVDPERDEPVAQEEVRKGYEAEPGVFVVLDEEDLEAAQPEASRDVEVTRFVEPAELGHQWYERPYWLGPDGKDAAPAYFALARALAAEDREGVARWTMRNKSYVGALRPRDGHLVLVTLRKAGEVITAADLPAPKGRKVDDREVKMAEQLVAALEDEFRPEDYRDEYRERIHELVEAKAAGRKVKVKKLRRKRETGDLAGALSKSLEQAGKERRRAS